MRQILYAAIASLAGVSASAEEALWDLGLGISAVSIPHYIGADQGENYVLPFPYFVYRGDKLKVDRNFIHGRLFEQGDWRAEWSISGSPPVKSEDNDARAGMPDLDAIGEFGPSLMYTIQRDDNTLWRLEMPLRAAASSDFHTVDFRGFTFSPVLRLNQQWQTLGARWMLESSTGPVYSSERYHDYFYQVDADYATEQRSAYDAEAGFGGWRFALGMSYRRKNFWAGAFFRYMDLRDAQFVDSPLVKREDSWLFGFALAWIVRSSSRSSEEWCARDSTDFSETC